jgi:hypothetical protein
MKPPLSDHFGELCRAIKSGWQAKREHRLIEEHEAAEQELSGMRDALKF